MASIRQLASSIGLSGNIKIVGDFFGYAKAPPWTSAPTQNFLAQSLSLLKQAKLIKGKHIHLNLIRVGTVPVPVGTDEVELLSPAEEEAIDCAVQIARDVFAAVGLGIGRVERGWHIPLADNTGYDVIDSDDEAEDLVDAYSVGNDGIDVFYVPLYVDIPPTATAGLTPAKGDGVVVEIFTSEIFTTGNGFHQTGRTTAHELGHFLGLGHENDKPENLMCQSAFANAFPNGVTLNSDQVSTIMDNDAVQPGSALIMASATPADDIPSRST